MSLRFSVLALVLVCSLAGADESRPHPTAKAFRKHLLAVMKEYPADGTHRYHWPKSGSWRGVTRDLVYQGETIAEGDAEGRAFCCGLTFEAFFRAWERWAKAEKVKFDIAGLDAKGVKKLILAWFGSAKEKTCTYAAIKKFGLGRQIDDLSQAKPGDFVQFWRHSGSGHSVIFVAWEKDKKGERVGLKYWSTQTKTKGIGINSERIGPKGIKKDEIYIARVGQVE